MAFIGNDLSTIVKQGKTAYKYVATEGQTSFSGSDANGITLNCTADTFANVYLNGVRLIKGDDFTLSSNELTLLVGASADDELMIVADIESATYTSYTKSETYSKAETDVKIVELSPPTDLSAYSTTTQMNAAISAEVANLVDSSPATLDTLNELAAALGDDPNFATTITNALANKANISSGTSTPGSPNTGDLWYDTNAGIQALKIYNGTEFIKVSITIPVLNSVSGSIYNTLSSTLTLTGTGFMSSNLSVHFNVGGTDYDVSTTASSDTTATVSVPSSIYNMAGGTSVSISVTNIDGGKSGAVSKSIIGLPSGGNITTSGSWRIHTFTGSSTFTVPSGFSGSAEFLIIAGGGSGGVGSNGNDCGGGGAGAGGYISSVQGESSGGGCGATSTYSFSSGSYPVVVGAGGGARVGGGNAGYNGGNSSVFGMTAIGGGGGSNRDSVPGSGGSGGGGSCTGNYGNGTSCQGYRGGGAGGTPSGGTYGGGGAGGYDNTVRSAVGGPGGAGVNSSITGSSVGRAGGGGGGGGQSTGGAASHGGGAGGNSPRGTGGSGTANTGGGGGGAGGYADSSTTSGAGGSGVVIIRYQV